MKKLLIILIAITALAEGCKKYEEGPCISLRSAKSIFKGTYTLNQYTVNGIDSLDTYYDSLGLSFKFWHNEDNDADICIMDGPRKDGFSGDLYWGWKLSKNKKSFIVLGSTGSSIGAGPFGITKTPEWNIIRLEKGDIKMKTNYNGKEYFIELK